MIYLSIKQEDAHDQIFQAGLSCNLRQVQSQSPGLGSRLVMPEAAVGQICRVVKAVLTKHINCCPQVLPVGQAHVVSWDSSIHQVQHDFVRHVCGVKDNLAQQVVPVVYAEDAKALH